MVGADKVSWSLSGSLSLRWRVASLQAGVEGTRTWREVVVLHHKELDELAGRDFDENQAVQLHENQLTLAILQHGVAAGLEAVVLVVDLALAGCPCLGACCTLFEKYLYNFRKYYATQFNRETKTDKN